MNFYIKNDIIQNINYSKYIHFNLFFNLLVFNKNYILEKKNN